MRVLLVDSSTLFRQGLTKVLEAQPDIEVLGEAGDGWEALVEAHDQSAGTDIIR